MSSYKLIIGSRNYSSWSLRGWLAMQQSGAEFEEVVIPFYTGDRTQLIQAQSPSGLLPVLEDGDLVINDSLAIAEYLAERHPEAGLWPADTSARAIARAAAAEMHLGFGALRSDLPMNFSLLREGLVRSAEVDADIRPITDVWESCQFRYGAGGDFRSALSASPMRCMHLLSHACAPIACPSSPEALPIWTPSGPTPWMQTWGEKAADEPRVEKYEDI